jgi:hypothetical protein
MSTSHNATIVRPDGTRVPVIAVIADRSTQYRSDWGGYVIVRPPNTLKNASDQTTLYVEMPSSGQQCGDCILTNMVMLLDGGVLVERHDIVGSGPWIELMPGA